MSLEEIKQILAEVAISTQKLAERQEAAAKEMAERKAEFQAHHEAFQKDMAALKKRQDQNQKQLGELGNSLGGFAEGLAYPTVERIMQNDFKMDNVSRSTRLRRGGETIEIDIFGSTNGSINTCIVGEVKAYFREQHVEQTENICLRLFDFMPEHRGKKVFGMVIFVKGDQNAIDLATKRGIYTVQANDENFKIRSPKNFAPRDFSQA